MKKIILLLCFVPFIGFSQENSKELIYTNVVKVDSLVTSKEMFVNAKSWFAEKYKNSKNVIQYEDKEEGKIIGKGSFSYRSNVFMGNASSAGQINYTITVYVKDGKYKYEVTNIIHDGATVSYGLITNEEDFVKDRIPKKWITKVWVDLKKQTDEYCISLTTSLNSYMLRSILVKDKNW